MKSVEIIVTATPSLNELNGKWNKLNWKKKYLKEIYGYCYTIGVSPGDKRKVTITRHGSRILDEDNFIGGTKALTDALKESKLIFDDSAKYCELIFMPQQKVERGKEYTRVLIERQGR
jgi:hypothetical protein